MTSCVRKGHWDACPRPPISASDLFEKSDDILAHVRQPDNDVVVVDVAEGGVVSALPPRLLQDQIPAVHGGHQILVLSERARRRTSGSQIQQQKHLAAVVSEEAEEPERPQCLKHRMAASTRWNVE